MHSKSGGSRSIHSYSLWVAFLVSIVVNVFVLILVGIKYLALARKSDSLMFSTAVADFIPDVRITTSSSIHIEKLQLYSISSGMSQVDVSQMKYPSMDCVDDKVIIFSLFKPNDDISNYLRQISHSSYKKECTSIALAVFEGECLESLSFDGDGLISSLLPKLRGSGCISPVMRAVIGSIDRLLSLGYRKATIVSLNASSTMLDVKIPTISDSDISIARNILIRMGLFDEKYALWVDSDVRHIPRNTFSSLIQFASTGKGSVSILRGESETVRYFPSMIVGGNILKPRILVPHCIPHSENWEKSGEVLESSPNSSFKFVKSPNQHGSVSDIKEFIRDLDFKWMSSDKDRRSDDQWLRISKDQVNMNQIEFPHNYMNSSQALHRVDIIQGPVILIAAELHILGLLFPLDPVHHFSGYSGVGLSGLDFSATSYVLPHLIVTH